MIFAQITDLHILEPGERLAGVVDTAGHLEGAVAHLNAIRPRPDFVVATGDLVDHGRAAEYAHLRALLAPLAMPLFVLPGNHDERGAFREAFADHDYLPQGPFLHYTIDAHPLRLIALDTVVPGAPGGLMCEARCAWFADRLADAPDRPTAILMHHPPFTTGIGHMDDMGCDGAGRMAAVVRRHANVEQVLCGHLHRSIRTRWAGTVASTMPSTCHQVALDLTGGPARFVMEPPAVQLHLWTGRDLVSHLAYPGDYGPCHPFH